MFQLLKDLWWPTTVAFRKTPWLTSFALVTALLYVGFPALNVYVISQLSYAVANGQPLFLPAVMLILLFGSRNLIIQLMIVCALMNGSGTSKAFNNAFNQKAASIPVHFYSNSAFMEKVLLANNCLNEAYANMQHQAALSLIEITFSCLSMALALWHLNPYVAGIAALLPIPIVYNNLGYGRAINLHMGELARRDQRCHYLYNQLNQDRSGFDLAVMQASKDLATIAHQERLEWFGVARKLHRAAFMFGSLSGLCAVALYSVCIIIIVLQGDLVSIVTSIFGLTAALNTYIHVGYQLGTLSQCLPATRSLHQFLTTEFPDTKRVDLKGVAQVTFNDVMVAYGDKQAVQGVTVSLAKGQLTAIVGANGSGKTSLIKAIMNAQHQVSGSITFADQTINLTDRSQTLAYATVNQEFQRYDITIREFLTLGQPQPVSDDVIYQALEKVEFADYIRNLEQGLDTRTGVQWGGIDLSGGQWQRLCIARGFISNAGLLLLDEPTSAIDAPTEEKIFAELAQLAQEKLVLLTSHRVSTLKAAQMIYVMEAGKVVEQGSFDQLNQPGTKFYELFESQFVTESQGNELTGEVTMQLAS